MALPAPPVVTGVGRSALPVRYAVKGMAGLPARSLTRKNCCVAVAGSAARFPLVAMAFCQNASERAVLAWATKGPTPLPQLRFAWLPDLLTPQRTSPGAGTILYISPLVPLGPSAVDPKT